MSWVWIRGFFVMGVKLIFASDESGDSGLKFKKFNNHSLKVNNHYTTHKVVVGILTPSKNVSILVERADELFRKYFNHPLRKWNELKGKEKNQFDTIARIISEWSSNLQNTIFLTSVTIVDKLFYNSSADVTNATVEAYLIMYKRIIPFMKKLNYYGNKYQVGMPHIDWYIDIASNRSFTKPLKQETQKLSKSKKIILNGPKFLNKPKFYKDKDEELRTLSKFIVLTDFLAGAILRFLREYHISCREKHCKGCFNVTSPCVNMYKDVWLNVYKFLNIKLKYSNETIWHWKGLLYLPSQHRYDIPVQRYAGKDPFFTP